MKKINNKSTDLVTLCMEDLKKSIYNSNKVIFPSDKYQTDIISFCRDILGFEPYDKQKEILEAVVNHNRIAVKSGHKVGKALSLDTSILTTNGWSTMGDLKENDFVFAPDGKPTKIIAVTKPMYNHQVYQVNFSDGSSINADAEHLWEVHTKASRKAERRAKNPKSKPQILTTQQMFDKGVFTFHTKGEKEYSIPATKPIKYQKVNLPIDPYLLGAWLGDGDSNGGGFTSNDKEIIDIIESKGFEVSKHQAIYRYNIIKFIPTLRRNHLLYNKHIPISYFTSSIEQRTELVRGLMDTDGTIDKRGRPSFTNCNLSLVEGLKDLLISLGQIPSKITSRYTKDQFGHQGKLSYTIGFTPYNFNPFNLTRKANKIKIIRERRNHRKIISIIPIQSIPVKCIQVDHPSHLFLAGKELIPTHNSRTAIIIALWFYCSFPEARVIMTSTTAHQVKNILWRELTMIYEKAQKINPIDGTLSPLPSSGLKSFDHREIIGFTAREPEGVAGISGKLLYILDEASGIADNIYEAIEGNRAGGARIIMFSNPTRLTGEFYEAFHKKNKFYHTITISSEQTPNVIQNKEVIPNLACRDWIEEKKLEWGEDSPIYNVRIKGEFPNQEDFTVVPIHLVEQAIQRSTDEEIDLSLPEYNGRWFIGIDPAGQGSDESVICFRKNLRVIKLIAKNGLDAPQLLQLFQSEFHKLNNNQASAPGQLPTVIIDNTGGFGSGIIPYLDKSKFNVIPVHFASKPFNNEFINSRAEMWFNITAWLKTGDAILPDDDKLAYELTSVKYFLTGKGQRQIQDKEEIKKILKHSPDRADALALSLYNYYPNVLPKQKITVLPAYSKPIRKPTSIHQAILNPYGIILSNKK